jgi:sialic acid synthase SpsE
MLKRLELRLEDHECLLKHCVRRGITFLSTPFDHQSVDLLAGLGVAAYKIGSGDITNPPLLKHVASKQRPIILSTGMCNLSDVEMAVELLEGEGAEFAILHCVSNYPAAASDTNLRALMTLVTAFGVPVGYSDHTDGDCIALASVAMGACIVEKHFTLDRTLPGPDHQASLEPGELATMVRGIRTVEQAMGTGRKCPAVSEANTAEVARKSLVAEVDIEPGSLLTEEVIAIKRPGTGLPPSMRALILNRTACSRIAAGELIRLENVA